MEGEIPPELLRDPPEIPPGLLQYPLQIPPGLLRDPPETNDFFQLEVPPRVLLPPANSPEVLVQQHQEEGPYDNIDALLYGVFPVPAPVRQEEEEAPLNPDQSWDDYDDLPDLGNFSEDPDFKYFSSSADIPDNQVAPNFGDQPTSSPDPGDSNALVSVQPIVGRKRFLCSPKSGPEHTAKKRRVVNSDLRDGSVTRKRRIEEVLENSGHESSDRVKRIRGSALAGIPEKDPDRRREQRLEKKTNEEAGVMPEGNLEPGTEQTVDEQTVDELTMERHTIEGDQLPVIDASTDTTTAHLRKMTTHISPTDLKAIRKTFADINDVLRRANEAVEHGRSKNENTIAKDGNNSPSFKNIIDVPGRRNFDAQQGKEQAKIATFPESIPQQNPPPADTSAIQVAPTQNAIFHCRRQEQTLPNSVALLAPSNLQTAPASIGDLTNRRISELVFSFGIPVGLSNNNDVSQSAPTVAQAQPLAAGIEEPDGVVLEVGAVEEFVYKAIKVTDPFICGQCNKAFYEHNDLLSHIKSNHSDDHNTASMQCMYCGKELRNETNLRRHISKVHAGTPTDSCNACEATFSSRNAYIAHCRDRHGAVPPSLRRRNRRNLNPSDVRDIGEPQQDLVVWKCASCDKTVTSRGNVVRHIRILHLQERPHQCQHCSKRFPTKHNLHCHESSIHPSM